MGGGGRGCSRVRCVVRDGRRGERRCGADLTPALNFDVAFEVHIVLAACLLGLQFHACACVDFTQDNREFGGPLEDLAVN
jgi:hypothetical protein